MIVMYRYTLSNHVLTHQWINYYTITGLICTRFNTLKPRQNGAHFTDDMFMFKHVPVDENFWCLNKISLQYVPWGLIDYMAALVQIMAWRRSGDNPLSEPVVVCSTDAYMRHSASMGNNTGNSNGKNSVNTIGTNYASYEMKISVMISLTQKSFR